MELEHLYARTTRALLQGRPAPDPGLPRLEELRERADAGDGDARALLEVAGVLEVLPARIAAALAREATPVVLADGSSLSLDEAERVLAAKEERRAHVPLRASIDAAARASFLQLPNRFIGVRGPLEAFLAETKPLREPAREALASLGGEAPASPPALARALDLPDGDGAFSDAVTTSLLAAAREAHGAPLTIARFRAPRAMAGAVFVDDEGARFAHPPLIARFERHHRTLEAGATALARVHGRDASYGLALALGLTGTAARRATGAARSTAERAARIAAAAGLLGARAQAVVAISNRDDLRDALADALGSDPGAALTAQLSQPPWSMEPSGALHRIASAGVALALRDRFDEGFALQRHALRDAVEPVPHGWTLMAAELL